MTVKEMKQKKKELGYSYEQISQMSGMPVGTVQKVLSGITKSPRYDTLKALESVFVPESQEMLEEAAVYRIEKQSGSYTLEDYYALPDDRRAELDVQLDKDDRTMIQPDFFVVCDKSKIKKELRWVLRILL